VITPSIVAAGGVLRGRPRFLPGLSGCAGFRPALDPICDLGLGPDARIRTELLPLGEAAVFNQFVKGWPVADDAALAQVGKTQEFWQHLRPGLSLVPLCWLPCKGAI